MNHIFSSVWKNAGFVECLKCEFWDILERQVLVWGFLSEEVVAGGLCCLTDKKSLLRFWGFFSSFVLCSIKGITSYIWRDGLPQKSCILFSAVFFFLSYLCGSLLIVVVQAIKNWILFALTCCSKRTDTQDQSWIINIRPKIFGGFSH